MDATRWNVIGVLIISAGLTQGCNQARFSMVSADCTAQAVPDSYLVKWNSVVPAEYQAYKLHPLSLVTRFTGDRAAIEQQVLQKHPSEYLVAEQEMRIKNIKDAQVQAADVTIPAAGATVNSAWGPADIQAQAAWAAGGKKGDGVIVAVIDSGADVNHPLLQSQIWINSKEVPNNGLDDEGDGLIDDYNGYNFADGNADLTDGAGHGTHVSGIIAGSAGSNSFTGIAPSAKIMVVKFIDSEGNGDVGAAITALSYAEAHGAQVVNASWGGSSCSAVLQQEIAGAAQAGIVFVNAAGNDGANISVAPEYPAIFQAPGKITIASSNSSELLSTFSNFGALVDVAAPGENILSTLAPTAGQAEGQMGYKSGTSMATPFVSGVAALLFSVKPNATPVQVVAAINASVSNEALNVNTRGRLNALAAVQYIMSH